MKTFSSFLLMLVSVSLFAQPNTITWETIIFDSASSHIHIEPYKSNIWLIGNPQKAYLDSAYSKSLCLATDTIESYPVNNSSFFDLYVSNQNHNGYHDNTFIEFKHKYDSDAGKDGLFITLSVDKGANWYNITDVYDSVLNQSWVEAELIPYFENMYIRSDTLFDGTPGFSGNSDGWVTSLFSWYAVFASLKSTSTEWADTMIVRFNFLSDNVDNQKEGWLIDNIRFYTIHLPGGATNTSESLKVKIFPNPATNNLNIDFPVVYRDIKIDILSLEGKVFYSRTYHNAENIVLQNLQLKPGYYVLRCQFNDEDVFQSLIVFR